MKNTMKSKWVLLVLASLGMTLAMAGNAVASPCLHLDVYTNPDGTGTKEVCLGLEVPYFGVPVGSDGTEVLNSNGRLWFGTDTGWNWRDENDYKAVLYGGIVNKTGVAALGEVQLIILSQASYAGQNAGTLKVYDPNTNTPFAITSFGTSGDTLRDYWNVKFNMQPGVFYPFMVEYAHYSGSADGFDFRLLSTASFLDPGTCPPVPEPSTLLLLGLGLIGMGAASRRKFGK